MDDREKKKKILFTILGVILLVLLFFLIKSCSGGGSEIKDNKIKITNIDVKTETVSLEVGDVESLTYSILPSNTEETTKWVSSDESVVSVDTKGKITALKTGNAIVSLVSEGGVSDYAVIKVVSKKAVDGSTISISLVEKDITIKVGASKTLLFNLDPKDTPYNEVTWESSNNLVASVADSGSVTALRSGVTTVTVKVVLNDNSVITDSATVTVEDNAALYLTNNISNISKGEVFRVSAALSDASVSLVDGNVKSANDKIASVSNINTDNNYLTFDVTGVKEGNTTLKLSGTTSDGKNLSLDVPITVEGYTDLYISSGDKEIKVGETLVLSGRLVPAISGNMDTICTSSSTKVATVSTTDPSGEYNGACQIVAVTKGSSNISINIAGEKKSIKVTVVETTTDNPSDNPSDNPGDSTDETGGTLESLEATLDKTTYERNAQMGTLTVTAIDSAGKKTVLTSKEYTMVNDFDSSTPGTKTLNIAYTKDGVSKVAKVSYTVTGSTLSGGSTSGSSGYGGSSSSGGGHSSSSGGGNSGNGTLPYTVTDFKISDDIDQQADGTYKGELNLEAKVQGDIPKGTHYYAILLECSESKDTRKSECTQDSSDFVGARVYEGTVKDGKITYNIPTTNTAGTVVAITGGSWEDENDIKTFYTKDGHTLLDSKKTAVLLSNTADWQYLTGPNGEEKYSFATTAGVGPSQSANTGKLGTFTLSASKFWYNSTSNISIKVDVKTSKDTYKIQAVTVEGKKTCISSSTICSTTIFVDAPDKKVTGAALILNTETNKTEAIYATIQVKVDVDDPICKITKSTTSNSLIVRGYEKNADRTKDSGILSLKSTGPQTPKMETITEATEFSVGKSLAIVDSGTYVYTVTDKSGRSFSCSTTVKLYYCAQDSYCGDKIPGHTEEECGQCPKAGCKSSTNTVHQLYYCTSNGNDPRMLYIDGEEYGPDENGNMSFPEKIENVVDPRDKKVVSCTIEKNDNTKLTYKCLQKNTIVEVGQINQEGEFNNNCKLCGCKSQTQWSDGGSFASSVWQSKGQIEPVGLGAGDTFTTIRRVAMSMDSQCKNIITESIKYLCGQGASINRSECSQG